MPLLHITNTYTVHHVSKIRGIIEKQTHIFREDVRWRTILRPLLLIIIIESKKACSNSGVAIVTASFSITLRLKFKPFHFCYDLLAFLLYLSWYLYFLFTLSKIMFGALRIDKVFNEHPNTCCVNGKWGQNGFNLETHWLIINFVWNDW